MKDFNESSIVKSYLEAAKKANMKEPTNNTVGNNGYALGQEFHSTGALQVVETEINGNKTAYVAVETEEGTLLSIKSLMNISSLQGYETEGKFTSESKEGGKTVSTEVVAKVVDDFSFDDVYQPSTRQLLSFIADCEENSTFKGKTIRYLGTVVRPYTAKKPSPRTSFEKYEAGMQRAMSVRLWSVH